MSERIRHLAAHLLRRHVPNRPEDRPRFCPARDRRGIVRGEHNLLARQAEVEDLDAAVSSDEQVVGFEIAMDDASFVRGAEAVGDLNGVIDGLPGRQRTVRQQPAQRLAVEQFHDGVCDAVRAAEVKDREDIRVRSCSEGLGFPFKPFEGATITREMLREHLHSHIPIQLCVARTVDLAHAAGAERAKDFIRAKPGSGCEAHGE
jgi:hypothetical protein